MPTPSRSPFLLTSSSMAVKSATNSRSLRTGIAGYRVSLPSFSIGPSMFSKSLVIRMKHLVSFYINSVEIRFV